VKVVMVSGTALAGAPYELMKCLNRYTDVQTRWIALRTGYSDGRVFPCDLLWVRDRVKCIEELKYADIVHVHNESCSWIGDLIKGKKVLIQFHSCPKRNTYKDLKQLSGNCYTLYQPMQLREYSGLPGLPNLIDPEEYRPIERKNMGRPIVVFAPTNSWKMFQIGSKASEEVVKILQGLRGLAAVDIFSNLVYVENLKRKQLADIVIDDVVGETFHRTSLEGACFGLAVLTSDGSKGFMYTQLSSLEKNLRALLEDKSLLREYQGRSRRWIETDWHPRNMVGMYISAYKKVLHGYS